MATDPAPIHSAADAREGVRTRTLFAIGKLVLRGRQRVCTVRNISDGGVGIQVDDPLQVGDRVEISLRGLPPTEAEVRWIDGGAAGLAFLTRVEIDRIDTDRTPRSPRFNLEKAAQLFVDERHIYVETVDLALGGVKLAASVPVRVGAPAIVVIDGDGAELRGLVCWRSRTEMGIRFATPLPATRLATILSSVTAGPNNSAPPQEPVA